MSTAASTAAVRVALVTGGGGYVGSRLCHKLLEESRGYERVIAFDLHFISKDTTTSRITQIEGDVRNYNELKEVMLTVQPTVIFHIASYGMSGHQMFNRPMIESVNIHGTNNIIKVCIELGVQYLVYTSTYNVVFGGQRILNGKESSLSYFPLEQHVDHYSRTKSIAEQSILAANGTHILSTNDDNDDDDGRVLKTCALRCAGIYGEGEQRHLPRIVGYLRDGLVLFTFGDKDNKVDFLHVDNFVQAHIKAAEGLASPLSIPSGEAYFISDNNPVDNFLFFKPLMTGLGYTYPKLRLPLWIVYYLAYLIEICHGLISKCYNFQPFLTRAEVFKAGVTHYFSIERASKDFGYKPEPKNLDGVVRWFEERGYHKRDTMSSVGLYLKIMTVILFIIAIIVLII